MGVVTPVVYTVTAVYLIIFKIWLVKQINRNIVNKIYVNFAFNRS